MMFKAATCPCAAPETRDHLENALMRSILLEAPSSTACIRARFTWIMCMLPGLLTNSRSCLLRPDRNRIRYRAPHSTSSLSRRSVARSIFRASRVLRAPPSRRRALASQHCPTRKAVAFDQDGLCHLARLVPAPRTHSCTALTPCTHKKRRPSSWSCTFKHSIQAMLLSSCVSYVLLFASASLVLAETNWPAEIDRVLTQGCSSSQVDCYNRHKSVHVIHC
jgi:hypothetical protein